MQGEFLQMMERFEVSRSGKLILAAISGGVDSMVLATLLYENEFPFAVAHCNYQLREAESDKDEELVRNWCVERRIPFYARKIATQKLAKASGDSIQIVARKTRYAFFNELVKKHNFSVTALAHHANDRVESLLINVLRGTGIRGLQGMPSKRAGIIRPLIGFSKEEILAYAKEKQVLFRDDASNFETYYQRNWVRLRLLPMLQQTDANAFSQLKKLCERVENEMPNYRISIAEKLAEVKTEAGGWSIAAIQDSKTPFTLLKELLGSKGFSSEQVFEVIAIMNSESGAQVCSETHRVVKNRNQLFLSELEFSEEKPLLNFQILDRANITSLKTPRNIALIDASSVGAYGNTPALIDASFAEAHGNTPAGFIESSNSEFKIRKWKVGDRFKPLGMKGWKKLSDFFIDEKISILEKEQAWILTYKEEIVWIVGMRLDNRFKVRETTKKVLKIRFER